MREFSNEYLLEKFGFDIAEHEPYYFEISSSREFESELRTYEPLICNPELFSSEDHWRLCDLDPLLAEGDTAWRQRHRSCSWATTAPVRLFSQ